MKYLLSLLLIILSASGVEAAPKDAVVRIPSHGGSGTVVATGQGWTLILSCGHLFGDPNSGHADPSSVRKPIALDLPHPIPGQPQRVGVRYLNADFHADLSLILMNAGPMPYVSPVAPAGFKPGACLSVGYDEMKLPGQCRPAHIVAYEGGFTYTRERPWHGRSGGGLIDQHTGFLVGVVSAYTGPRDHREISGNNRGVYASHTAILAFLRRSKVIQMDESPYDPRSEPFIPQGSPQGGYAQPEPWTPPPTPFTQPPLRPRGCPT